MIFWFILLFVVGVCISFNGVLSIAKNTDIEHLEQSYSALTINALPLYHQNTIRLALLEIPEVLFVYDSLTFRKAYSIIVV